MQDETMYVRALETKITRHQSGAGYLEVHTKYVAGEKVMEAFTLSSLAEVLDMPMTTMEGRYARAKLHHWKVDISNGSGRPVRGFPMALLAEVVEMIRTPGACVKHSPNGDTIVKRTRTAGSNVLVPTYFDNKPYFTIAALAEYYGFSPTTIRNKLQRAGLMKRLVNLGSSMHGGRPTRGMPESALGDVELAIVSGVKFVTEVDRILASTGRQREEAKERVVVDIASHLPPAGMRAFSPTPAATLAPVLPLNAVNPRPAELRQQSNQVDAAEIAADVVAQLETIFAGAPKAPDHVTTPPLSTDRVPAETIPTPTDGDDPRIVARRMWELQRDALATQDDEPTLAEFRDTCDMLGLDKAAADRFMEEVNAARRTA